MLQILYQNQHKVWAYMDTESNRPAGKSAQIAALNRSAEEVSSK
jgi:hypothetical protein